MLCPECGVVIGSGPLDARHTHDSPPPALGLLRSALRGVGRLLRRTARRQQIGEVM